MKKSCLIIEEFQAERHTEPDQVLSKYIGTWYCQISHFYHRFHGWKCSRIYRKYVGGDIKGEEGERKKEGNDRITKEDRDVFQMTPELYTCWNVGEIIKSVEMVGEKKGTQGTHFERLSRKEEGEVKEI